MVILTQNEQGQAAVATGTLKTGQIVKCSVAADGSLTAAVVTGSGDASARVGMAYSDPAKKQYLRGTALVNASLTSMEAEQVAVGETISVLQGRCRLSTNQLNDGTYNSGDKLTVDWATARLKKAGGGDTVFARVELGFGGGIAVSQNLIVPVIFSMPEAL